MMKSSYAVISSVPFFLLLVTNFNVVFGIDFTDPNLEAKTVVTGLVHPTSMLFLDNNNILVLEKEGNIRIISNGILEPNPMLTLDVDSKNERGLLGVDKINNEVFIYMTEKDDNGEDKNRLYKYKLVGLTISDPQMILDLPATPGTNHQGGKITVGKDSTLFSVTGEMQREGKDQNINDGPAPDYSGSILRVNSDGTPANGNPFINESDEILKSYQAYGVRNSFGIGVDSVTGALWDTENGDREYDEINYVFPGFNSGWKLVMGPISQAGITENELVNIPGSKYADPILSFKDPVAVTEIEFLSSNKLGDKYLNNAFVGDYNNGNLYRFELNDQRNDFKLDSAGLADRVVDSEEELNSIVFGKGFGAITDIKTGPDGYLYILDYSQGDLYKIVSVS